MGRERTDGRRQARKRDAFCATDIMCLSLNNWSTQKLQPKINNEIPNFCTKPSLLVFGTTAYLQPFGLCLKCTHQSLHGSIAW